VSSSLHTDLAASVEVVEFSIPQWKTVASDDPDAAKPARVYIAGDLKNHWKLLAVSGPAKSWGHVSSDDTGEVTSRRPSRFLPEKFRWTDIVKRKPKGDPDYSSGLKLKSFDCTGVMYHRKSWNMIKKRGGACQAILDGKFYFPTVKEGVVHCSHPNLKSVEEDKALLYRMICKYLISGALEYCPPGFRPTNLVQLGLVPEKDMNEPFRVIADGRQMNEYMLPWKTKMTGMAASAGMFVRGSYAFLRDFSSAYHNVPLGTPCNR